VYAATESWEPSNIGTHLAYLVWEIASPRERTDWTTPDTRPILELFDDLFPGDDDVWAYIDRGPKRHFVVTGRVPFQEQQCAHVAAFSPTLAVRQFARGWLYDGDALPDHWWELPYNPETGDPWWVIDGVIEISGEPIAIHAGHEFSDI
jgi:hypothetical protein